MPDEIRARMRRKAMSASYWTVHGKCEDLIDRTRGELPDPSTARGGRGGGGREREDYAKRCQRRRLIRKGNMLLSCFNLCQASLREGPRLRRAIVAGECIPLLPARVAVRSHRGNISGKMIAPPFARASSARSIHHVSIFSAFSLRSHLTRPLVPVRCLGRFLFRSLTSLTRASRLPLERSYERT